MKEIKEGDVVRLKKEVLETGAGRIYDCVMMTDKIFDDLGNAKLVVGRRKPGTAAWEVRRLYDDSVGPYLVGEDALELVQRVADAKPAETPNAEEAAVVRIYKQFARAGGTSATYQAAYVAHRVSEKIMDEHVDLYEGFAMLRNIAIDGAIVARLCANEPERGKEGDDVEF